MERLTCYMLGTRTQTGRGSQNLVDNTDVPFYQIPGDKQELSRNRQTPVLYSIESELLPKRERHAVFGKERGAGLTWRARTLGQVGRSFGLALHEFVTRVSRLVRLQYPI